MSGAVNNETCPICGNIPHDRERRVLVNGRRRTSYCSQACLRVGVRMTQLAERTARLRRWGYLVTFVIAFAIGGYPACGWHSSDDPQYAAGLYRSGT